MKPKDSDDQFSSKFDFSRNSNAYSSLPNNIELKRQKKKQALEQLDKNNASSSIDRRRKTTPKNSNNKTKLDNAVSTQPYAVLNESLDYGYGLSNNLSSESIRNACDFYDDEISDTDLVEVHQTPQAFQNSKSNSLKRCLEESPLRALSLKQAKHSEQKEHETCFKDEDEALNVLSELDAILDNHEMLSMSEDAKVEDCLLELDDYLQKIEDDDDEQACNDDNIEHAVEDSMHFVHEANMHDLACEPSCPTEEDLSPSISDLGAGYDLLSSCSNSLNTQNCSSHATDLLLPLSCSKQTKLSQATDDAISPLNTSTPSNQPEVLTQDSIFNTLLIQNIPENSMEDRPRQFGRRAEGAHPLFLSINTQRSNANNVSNRLNQNQRPMSAPVASAAADNALELNSSQQAQSALFIGGSDASSARSSRNASPISIVSSSDYSSTAASTNDQMDTNLVMHENVLQNQASSCSDTDNETANAAAVGANAAASKKDFNHGWPWGLCRTFALLCCTLGLFNVCRFAVVTMNYGVNFLIQFAILSFIFGIPFLWLNMCLGAKIKSGPVSMWKISPICRGIGIALTTLQYIMAVYSIVALAWILSYLRNTIPHTADNHNSSSAYPWQQQVGFLWKYHNSTNRPITDTVANYFNVVVLQRFTMGSPFDNNFTSKFRVCNEVSISFYICKGTLMMLYIFTACIFFNLHMGSCIFHLM